MRKSFWDPIDTRVRMMVERGRCELCDDMPKALFQVSAFVVCKSCLSKVLPNGHSPENCFQNPQYARGQPEPEPLPVMEVESHAEL